MLELIIGTKTKACTGQFIEAVRGIGLDEGTLYIGYPVVTTHQESIGVDALLVSQRHGLVVFDLLDEAVGRLSVLEWEAIAARETRLFLGLQSKLLLDPELTRRRQLAVPIAVLAYSSSEFVPPPDLEILPAWPASLAARLLERDGVAERRLYQALNAAVERVTTLRPKNRRTKVSRSESRGSIVKEIEREIANLDRNQKRSAIETPDGPQRIRGLAGSGKTVVLALKAAYLHAQHPEWTIALTFSSRALRQQLMDLVRRFSFEHTSDEPDWSHLRVLHAWGSPRQPGFYSEVAASAGIAPLTWLDARNRFGADRAFEGACEQVAGELGRRSLPPLYDAVLIDEAQDLPRGFFELAYHAARDPKRIVWAYDELQNLGEHQMVPPEELFGRDPHGVPRVKLVAAMDEAHPDIVLPTCYRNPPWALATAHALGFGVYRSQGLVQFFDESRLWTEIGYQIVTGEPAAGHHVVMERAPTSAPQFFSRLLGPDDVVRWRQFPDSAAQLEWVVEQIRENLTRDELEPTDLVVVDADPQSTESLPPLLARLHQAGIPAHIAGVTNSVDEFTVAGNVTLTGIYRAKGNEAPMVYIIDSEACLGGPGLARSRNILFTAITRARAWVRICGVGPAMGELGAEIEEVRRHGFRLDFNVPALEQLRQLRRIHRDMSPEEKRRTKSAKEKLEQISDQLERGEIDAEQLPAGLRARLASHFSGPAKEGA